MKKGSHKRRRRCQAACRRHMIHHDDVNMALVWRGLEKLYVSGMSISSGSNDDGGGDGGNKTALGGLLRDDCGDDDDDGDAIPAILSSSTVPRVDLNAYLRTEMAVRPPCELGVTLHWLAVDGVSPMIPPKQGILDIIEG